MSLESFFGLDDADAQKGREASEKFQEQMRQSAAAAKAIAGHQQRQKGKEDRLAALLVKYLQDQSKSDLVFLIVRLLGENVPGAFILAVLSIFDAEIQDELQKSFQALEVQAPTSAFGTGSQVPEVVRLPATLREDLNAWGTAILKAGLLMPGRTLETVLTPDYKLKSLVLDLLDYALYEYFERHGFDLGDDEIRQFALLSIQSVLISLREKNKQMTDAEWIETPLESTE